MHIILIGDPVGTSDAVPSEHDVTYYTVNRDSVRIVLYGKVTLKRCLV